MKGLAQWQRSTFSRVQLIVLVVFLLISFYMQLILQLVPCVLCYIQRLILSFLVVLCLLKYWRLQYCKRTWFFDMLFAISIVLGMLLSYHHVHLQNNPHLYQDACMPSFEILWRYYDVETMLKLLFGASHGCNEVMWQILGISIPGWLLLGYAVVFFVWWLEWLAVWSRRGA
jgi:protein dithiol:quinone oxidoreductase